MSWIRPVPWGAGRFVLIAGGACTCLRWSRFGLSFWLGSMLDLLTEGGSRPASRGTFFCFAKRQVPKEKATRLSASLRYVSLRSGQTCITQFSLRCRPTRCALAALRSDKRRQIRAQSIGTLRCQCPQTELRAAGAARRADAGGLRDL